MPRTRSARAKAASDRIPGHSDDGDAGWADSFAAASRALSDLRKKIRSLQRERDNLAHQNGELSRQINALHEAAEGQGTSVQPRRGRSGRAVMAEKWLADSQRRLNAEEEENERLRKELAKQKKAVKALERKELQADADELLNEAEHGVPDAEHRMRKLLRRFADTVLLSVVRDEECSICFESLKPKECSSFPCQHAFCNGCIRELTVKVSSADGSMISCPTCRKESSRDDLDLIQHTAQQQWDALLAIATDFSEMDQRNKYMDTSDEEQEERLRDNFIDDGTSRYASPAVSDAPVIEDTVYLTPRKRRRILESTTSADEGEGANDEEGEPVAGPSRSPLYSNASPSDKKRKMDELAASRKKKRRL